MRQRRRPSRTPRLQLPIESLEPRRLLATFSGTANADLIEIVAANGITQVVINGVSQTTADATVVVNALGGDDDVHFPLLDTNGGAGTNLTINLGTGNDLATNIDHSNGNGDLGDFQFGVTVNGEGGNDTLAVSNTQGPGFIVHRLEQSPLPNSLATLTIIRAQSAPQFRFSTMEDLTIDGCSLTDRYELRSKTDALRVNVSGNGGDDTFVTGFFDSLDPSTAIDWSEEGGWTSGTTTVSGGAGHDHITFEDRSAAVHPGGYVEDTFTLTKNGRGFTYSSIEEQDVRCATGNLVNVNAMTGFLETTRLFAFNCNVNLGNGNLTNLSGAININGGNGASTTIAFNDQLDTGNDNYVLATNIFGEGTLTKNSTQVFTFTNFAGPNNFLALTANQSANNIFINKTPGYPVALNAGGGDDTVNVGNGDIGANIHNNVSINGGTGANLVSFNNTQDPAPGVQTLDGLTFADAQTFTLSSVSSIVVENGGSGAGTFNLLRSSVFTLVSGGGANETVNIGNGNLDANLLADVAVSNAGNVTADDRLDAGDDGYVVNLEVIQKTTAGAHTVTVSNCAAQILQANNGNNTITVNNGGNALRIFANGGNDSVVVADTKPNFGVETIGVDTGTEVAGGPGGGDTINVNSDAGAANDAPARVRLLNNDSFFNLILHQQSVFQVPTGVTGAITNGISFAGSIDLAGGAMVFRNFGPSMNNFIPKIATGFNGGTWTGTGTQGAFNSSLASGSSLPDGVGYAVAGDIFATFPSNFGGVQVNANDALFRYTYYGDADLNGVVNFDDYSRVDFGFNQSRTRWSDGNFNYDNVINFDDYALIDLAFNSNLVPLSGTTGAEYRFGPA